MTTIADAVAELTETQTPVLCLDTCVYLDAITLGNRGLADQIRLYRMILDVLGATPGRLRLIANELVITEWDQRNEEVRQEVEVWLQKTDSNIEQVYRARQELGQTLPGEAPKLFDSQLVLDLSALGRSLLEQSLILRLEPELTLRAVQRVRGKQWPSHTGHVKDSIHLEHYLEFSRRLLQTGHTQARTFVSTNKKDFWTDRNTPEIHKKLDEELKEAGLDFYGQLPRAMKAMGILRSGKT